MQSTQVRAPPKSAGDGQLHVILGQKSELFKFRQCLRDCGNIFDERADDGEADATYTTRLLQCGDDIVIVLGGRGIGIQNPLVLGPESNLESSKHGFCTMFSRVENLDPQVM